ncbi:MAG: Phosphomannomutase/phosphoglucomutase [Phycisphaerae bacterium]|nr:Phosphomannomutase/phosphoglucomutase [Phycisphaerae bacterium]
MSLLMSVSGIRGVVGRTFTAQTVRRAVAGFVAALRTGGVAPGDGLRIVAARDSRPSGGTFLADAVGALAACGCEVHCLGIVSTPCAAAHVRRIRAAGGLILTASHNPPEYNGVKFITADGAAPDAASAGRILDFVRAAADVPSAAATPADPTATKEAIRRHVTDVLACVDVARIRSRAFHVVLDSVCGAGGEEGAALLDALGCRVTHLHADPTGIFPHPPEPLEANLGELCETVLRVSADVGFAQDPDADRLALVDERGVYVGEEYTLALAARNVARTRTGVFAANLSTSRMIDDVAGAAPGCRVERSAVGEANVVEAMRRTGAVLGGEGNGGVIDPRVGWTRDSLVAMAQVLDLLAVTATELSAQVRRYPAYAIVKHKVELPGEGPGPVLERIRARFHGERINDLDGLRIDRADAWVHVRASNTEPILRFIAEAPTRTTAEALIGEALQAL